MIALPSRLRVLALASLLGGATLAFLACGGTGVSVTTCAEKDQICGTDGKFHCRIVPANVQAIDTSCCPAERKLPTTAPSSGDGGGLGGDGGGLGDGGAVAAAGADAGADAGTDAGSSARKDAGQEPCDAGVTPRDASTADAALPVVDDAGVKFEFHCGRDICHPPAAPK